MSAGNIIVLLGVVLVALDLILWHATAAYRRHDLLSIGVFLIGVGVLAGAQGFAGG